MGRDVCFWGSDARGEVDVVWYRSLRLVGSRQRQEGLLRATVGSLAIWLLHKPSTSRSMDDHDHPHCDAPKGIAQKFPVTLFVYRTL